MIKNFFAVMSLIGLVLLATAISPVITSGTALSELRFQVSNLVFEPLIYVGIFCVVLVLAQKFKVWWAIWANMSFLALGLLPIFSDGDLSAIEKRVLSLEADIQVQEEKLEGLSASARVQFGNLTSSKIAQCRICFRETENSSQCQRNRSSCSGWSAVGSTGDWTQPFRDDTDKRSGGCTYQWRLECQ